MTSIPTPRTAGPAAPRAAAVSGGPAQSIMPAIDPVKLAKKYKWLLICSAIVGLGLGVAGHYTLRWLYPIWTPFALYECFPMEDKLGAPGATTSFGKDELEKFMATQVQYMMSDSVIDKAVNDPRLTKEAPQWCKPFYASGGLFDATEAARELKKKLGSGVLGESNLVKLSFSSKYKDDATAIVKLVGSIYLDDRKTITGGDFADRKKIISETITATNSEIGKLQDRKQRMLLEQSVDSLDQQMSSVAANMRNLQEKLVETRADKESLQVQLSQMEQELQSPVGISYPDDIRKKVDEDPTILRIKDEKNALESQLTAMRKQFGPTHRDILKLVALLEAKNQNLASEQEKLLRQYFAAKLDLVRMSVHSLEATEADAAKKLADEKTKAIELTQTISKIKDIDAEIMRLTESKNKLGDDLKTVEILSGGRREARVVLVQPARTPKTMSFPKLYIMIPAGIFSLLGLVGGSIILFELIDQRVKSPSDIAMIPRTKVLGIVPHAAEDPAAPPKVETVFRDQPGGVLAEHFRQLRGQVVKRMQQGGHKSLLVMSGMPGSGATSVVCNLGAALASADYKVLIVDANIRRPGIHRVLGLKEAPGLADVLSGKAKFADAIQKTDIENLSALTVGTASLRIFEQLTTAPKGELLRLAGEQFDYILIDVAPASIAGDAMAVANRCDASLLVVRAFGEKRGMVSRLRNDLGETRAEFLGVVVNAVRSSAGGYLKSNIQATHQYQSSQESAA
jgi:capsular exopolysaccharide synthesis family protein